MTPITTFPITTRAATATGNELMTAATPAAARAAIEAMQVDLPGPFANNEEALAAGVASRMPYLRSDGVVAFALVSIAAAEAYQQRVGLGQAATNRLSSFLADLAAASITPEWLVLGRSEFLSRNAGVYRAVIGTDGNVTGTVGNVPGGMQFDGIGANRVVFNNPFPSPVIPDMFLFAHASSNVDVEANTGALISAYVNTSDRGPELAFGSTQGLTARLNNVAGYVSPDNTGTANRHSVLPQVWPGVKKLSGIVFSGTDPSIPTGNPVNVRPFHIVKDLYSLTSTNETTQFYNNGASWTVGARPDGTARINGEIDLLIAGRQALSEAQRDALHAAALRHGIIQTSRPLILIGVGDSMTQGNAGSQDLGLARTALLMGRKQSGWVGGIYRDIAESSQGIDRQEELYVLAKQRILRYPAGVARWIMWWPGYNATPDTIADQGLREALIERYIDMIVDAKANGIESVVWARLTGADGTAATDTGGTSYLANIEFNNYLKARCQEKGAIFYDHTLTFDNSEFEGNSRNATYFIDVRHLSLLGQEVLVNDFISRFPNPVPPTPAEVSDPDAADYIANLIAEGASVAAPLQEAINQWFVDEKVAGTYSRYRHVYLPIWGAPGPDSLNLATRVKGSFVNDVIHDPGFVYSDTVGTPGHFDFGQDAVQMGLSNGDGYQCVLLLDAPGATINICGARDNADRQIRIATNSSTEIFANFGPRSVASATLDVRGIISSGRIADSAFLALRDGAGRSILGTSSVAAGGTLAVGVNYCGLGVNFLAGGVTTNTLRAGAWIVGLGLTAAEDEAATLRLKTLWETISGLALPVAIAETE